MTLEQNKAIAQRFIQEVFVKADEQPPDELATDDFMPHSWGQMQPGRREPEAGSAARHAGLEDARMTIEDVIAEGDKVVVRLISHGRHAGEFMGMPASGKEYDDLGDPHLPDRRTARSPSTGATPTCWA